MKSFISLVGLFAVVFSTSPAGADLKDYLYQQKLKRDAEISRLITTPLVLASTPKPAAPKLYPQLVDHFGGSASTFKQRFWIDSQFAGRASNAPVIFVICGEATCGGASDMESINKQAKRLKAHLVALEHRYYGYSIPTKDLSGPNLKYLSQAQSIADLARFQKYAMKKFALQGKWIAVGGSYPGNLSAFYRMKHPELVVGSLASSAPVLAKADFEEYDRHVAKVAGPDCLAQIQNSVKEVERRLKLGSAESIAVRKLFDAEKVRDDRDFLYVLADIASIAVQYGNQKKFCDALINAGSNIDDVVTAYGKVGSEIFKDFGIDAVTDSFQGAESIDPKDSIQGFGMRSWMYQSCTEFGYYQIAYSKPALSARSTQISEDYHDEVCDRLYGLKKKVDVTKTNRAWYENLFDKKVTNIFFTNGDNDPWSNLSILSGSADAKLNPALEFMTLSNASHCSDLGTSSNPSVVAAQKKIGALFDEWLK